MRAGGNHLNHRRSRRRRNRTAAKSAAGGCGPRGRDRALRAPFRGCAWAVIASNPKVARNIRQSPMVRYPPPVASDPTAKGDEMGRTVTAPVSAATRPEPAPPVDAVGSSVGRYRLEREL